MKMLKEVEQRRKQIVYLEMLLTVELIFLTCTVLLDLEMTYRAIGMILYLVTRLLQFYLQRISEGLFLSKQELFEIFLILIKNKQL